MSDISKQIVEVEKLLEAFMENQAYLLKKNQLLQQQVHELVLCLSQCNQCSLEPIAGCDLSTMSLICTHDLLRALRGIAGGSKIGQGSDKMLQCASTVQMAVSILFRYRIRPPNGLGP